MNKELIALKRIRQETIPATYNQDFDKEECCKIIETALNDNYFYLYIIDKICKYLSIDISSHRDLIETENEVFNTLVMNEKKLKALEIIKNKGISTCSVAMSYDDFERYSESCFRNYNPLTKEEYDLLKEILL